MPEERRQALEEWARLRLNVLEGDPWIALIGAVARLGDEGVDLDEAVDLVVGIVREDEPPAP